MIKQPHKHAELIKAWADGAEIEKRFGERWHRHGWCDIWAHDCEYRIKPEPKPDIVEYRHDSVDDQTPSIHPNLKLTFDGETGNLKEAVVL